MVIHLNWAAGRLPTADRCLADVKASIQSSRCDETARRLLMLIAPAALTESLHRRSSRRFIGLNGLELFALTSLHSRGTMIVGDIQRLLGVLPAQMSRIIRSLENRAIPLITCQINPTDKRKIDVHLTEAGVKALEDYESRRVQGIEEMLGRLSGDELENLDRIVAKLRGPLCENGDC